MGAVHSQLNWAILLYDVIPDGKTVWTAHFWLAIAQASELSFPVVFHTENCAVHSGNPIVSSVYLPTPRWHHLKALNLPKWIKFIQQMSTARYTPFQIPLLAPHFTLSFLLSYNIMADVASKQQKTALFLSTIVTRTKRHTELTKKNWKTWWETCDVPENIQFSFSCSSFYTVKLHTLT
jgi:hypothetical protein